MKRAGNRLRRLLQTSIALLAVSAGIVPASAQQVGTATITGTVVDGSGAAVPGATASVTEAATGAVRTAISNEAGVFRMAGLPIGQYGLKVELAGFRPVNVTQIALVSGDVRDLGRLALEVGAQTEFVTVTAEATPVQTADSSRRATVTGDQLVNLQLKGRDVFGMTSVVPGVLDTNNNRGFTTWTSMRAISINGAPSGNKNVLVDGISVVDEGANQNAFVNPNIDSVAEVQIVTNGFTAENGRNNGGLINIVTKSGTSKFKGSGWYNARRDQWNSIDYFRKAQNLPKALEHINIAGYSIGGPVVIPKVIDSRGSGARKLFFFLSQEFTNDAQPSTPQTANLPTALERAGNFSETRVTSGAIQPILDPRTGVAFQGNIIPAERIHPMGKALLDLLPMPNGYVNPTAGQQFTANFLFDQTPEHSRTSNTIRMDAVLSQTLRTSVKFLKDREDNYLYGQIVPGSGTVLNFIPGWVLSGSVTQVLRPTLINEINVGYGHNNFGNRRPDGFAYDDYFRTPTLDPPRFEPFEDAAPPGEIQGAQNDEWPYLPIMTFSGGNRAGLSSYYAGTTNGGGRVLPQANRNDRFSVQDDLSRTAGRHNVKTGVYVKYSSKTEPNLGSSYMGNFNFGSDPNNPLDTGNGYANALLGNFNTYTESTNRANPDMRQWQIEGYAQDSWRVNRNFTLDYGLRLTHTGAYYEINDANAGFFADDWSTANAPRLYAPVCRDGRPGNQACPQNLRAAVDPAKPGVFLNFANVGNIVPGSGSQLNGITANGISGNGDYYSYPSLVAAPRVGFAWDVTGNGKTAFRASAGVFYSRPGKGAYQYLGTPPTTFNRVIRQATIDDIANFATSGAQFVETPINSRLAGEDRDLERSYQTNVAFQRDVGFNTVVEAAYVGNFTRHGSRNVNLNDIPLYAYGNPANLFNNAPISTTFLVSTYPGLGTVQTTITDQDTLNYNALQLSVERRMTRGLQMGLSYTVGTAEGWQGYDRYTEELGGKDGLRQRYYGPTAEDRRHLLSVNYTYQIPSLTHASQWVRYLLSDWQVSGITKFQTGAPVNPSCTSNNTGVANTDPSLTGVVARCMLTGAPIDSGYTVDPSLPFADQAHFNLAAFAMAQPFSPTVGNFGNATLGLLRNPSWSNWDLTIARRIAVGRANVRLQFQAFNLFNQVEFTTLNASFAFTGTNNSLLNSTNTGKYTEVNPPRQMGVTVRVEF